jgi:hypothetical protein
VEIWVRHFKKENFPSCILKSNIRAHPFLSFSLPMRILKGQYSVNEIPVSSDSCNILKNYNSCITMKTVDI